MDTCHHPANISLTCATVQLLPAQFCSRWHCCWCVGRLPGRRWGDVLDRTGHGHVHRVRGQSHSQQQPDGEVWLAAAAFDLAPAPAAVAIAVAVPTSYWTCSHGTAGSLTLFSFAAPSQVYADATGTQTYNDSECGTPGCAGLPPTAATPAAYCSKWNTGQENSDILSTGTCTCRHGSSNGHYCGEWLVSRKVLAP